MTRSERVYAVMAAALFVCASPVQAEQLSLASDTIFRAFQRDRTDGSTANAAPVYQYLQLNYVSQKVPGLTAHIDGWGRLNLGDDYNKGTTDGQLLYAYLQYAPPKQNYQVRVGRQSIFEGVARDNFDGIYAKFLSLPRTTASVYAGVPTMLDNNGKNKDLIYGGKLTYSIPGQSDVGLSFKQTLDNGARRESVLGGDVAVNFPHNVSLVGHSTYDLIKSNWGEHSYQMRFPVGPVMFQPFLQRFRYTNYFSNRQNSVPPFRFLQQSANLLTTVGTDMFLYPSDRSEVVLRFKNYEYQDRFKASQYYSLIVNRRWNILSEVGGEVGRMQGNEADNRYLLTRAYVYWKFAPGFVTGDVMRTYYDRSIYGKSSALFASVGFGTSFLKDALTVKVSFDYSNDPYFKADYRVMVKLSYLLDKAFDPKSGSAAPMSALGGIQR